MKLSERLKREYRLLALAIVFFLAGGIFLWYDASLPPASKSPMSPAGGSGRAVAIAPSVESVSGNRGGTVLDPDFAKFPPPSNFTSFTYTQSGFNGSSSLPISTTCHDAYVAVLLFPSSIDYRGDINAAVYNEAFPCRTGQAFTLSIATSDLATAPFGTYYRIVADQGTSGTWYNPR